MLDGPAAARALAELPQVRGQVAAAIEWARRVGVWAPAPCTGSTRELWRFFAEVAAVDVAAARVMEPHLDALAILQQAPAPVDLDLVGADQHSTWGVFAAEAPGAPLTATREHDGWLLDGTKPWCSLAASLSHALVTASVGEERRLFAVALRDQGVSMDAGPWVPRGLTQIVSAPVHFERVRAAPVGGPGWYLARPGFFWGGISVAACWLGGAAGVARALLDAAQRREPDQLGLAHLGSVDTALAAARAVIDAAADRVDEPRQDLGELPILMLRARNTVAAASEHVLERVGHALGPSPLVSDERHAARVADLQLYLRQHHAERDEAALGHLLLTGGERRR